MKRNKNLTFKVYGKIIELMMNYELVPGQRLVFIDLARQLKVSRTPVNNALSILAQEGYLDFVPNQGYSVHRLSRPEAEDLYDIRDALEADFIVKAVRNVSDDGLRKIEKCKNDYENLLSTRVDRKLFIIDTEFHLAILSMAKNDVLLNRYKELCHKIFLRISIENLIVDRIRDIVREHDMLFRTIRDRDVDGARDLVRMHHQNSKRSLFPLIFPEYAGA
ncbi:GntR family transcriptional regulator [Desulforhopalus singaporensis]|uniref:DNA-binding transcriptional regulator, GntR family n=1 Tax=Desulforhopalus singaporensis TaxID=91360 RepID=A0A1H0ISZ0_9BACT|nr:GntR family transcriptional regulator [Desulforhopalus singaporensis]SDO34475.1 DNA-binding transcriptional regulator, GntR family [Desulforhopalus singaporensis]